MIEIKPPNSFHEALKDNEKVAIFLGGSIEMGKATEWQAKARSVFKDCDDVILLNPRRDAWDASWKQVKSNKKFKEQVTWELEALERANVICMYFDPATKSPISLLELGLFCNDWGVDQPLMNVVCPKGFWRKGNVDIVCERYEIPQHTSLTAMFKHIKKNLDTYRVKRY